MNIDERTEYTVTCDLCGDRHTEEAGECDSKDQFIRLIRDTGWRMDAFNDWTCPDCSVEKEEE